jgi:hypothetical protein
VIILHRIADAVANREVETIRIFPPDVRLFVGDRWVTIGRVTTTRTGFVMCVNVPPLAELMAKPEAEEAGWDSWACWGASVN